MGQLTQTTAQVQVILDDADAANVGKTSLTDSTDTTAVAVKKSGFYSLGASSSNAPSTDRAILISAVRDTAATGEIRYGQVAITESNGMWWNRDDGGSLGTWYEAVSTAGTQTLTNKTLTSPVLTTPQINDTSADHQYIFAVSELVADRTVTLPLLTGNDTFVFAAHTQTLTNKTLTSPVFDTGVSGTAVLDDDTFATASSTTLATSESIKAYVDTQLTAEDLDFAGDTGTGAVDLDSQTFTIAGTANEIETSATDQTLVIGLPNSVTITTALSVDTINEKTAAAGVTVDSLLIKDGGITAGGTSTFAGQTISDLGTVTTANIDGGSIDGTTIGAATAAAGTFTTVTADGGVSVDNITIDGTEIDLSSGDLTIDVAGDIILDADGGDVFLRDAGSEFGRFQGSNQDFLIRNDTQDKDISIVGNDGGATITALAFDMSDAGAATFNAGATFGSGIDVTGTVTADGLTVDHSVDTAATFTRTSANTYRIEHDLNQFYFWNATTSEAPLIFQNDGDVIMNAGNVGIGVTPSAWYPSVYTVMDVGASSAFGGYSSGASGDELTFVAGNVYYNSSNNPIYKADGLATNYRQFNGQHQFYTAASGTAGNTVSFSQAMTLDASGNLLVGITSSPDALIHAQAPKPTYTDYATVFAGGTDSNNGQHAISLMTSGNALAGILGSNLSIDGTAFSQPVTARSSGYISFQNATTAGKTSIITFGGLTPGTATALPKMTLDGDGNLLVGKTDTTGNVAGISLRSTGLIVGTVSSGTVGYFNRTTSDGTILDFRKDNTAVGSIGTEGGDLTIGTGDVGLKFNDSAGLISPWDMTANAPEDGLFDLGYNNGRFKDLYLSTNIHQGATTPSSSAAGVISEAIGRATYSRGSGTGGFAHLTFINGNGTVGTVTTSGSATAYNTSSDYRLKENVVAMTDATERLKQLAPKRFNFIADADVTVDGFLAHEVSDVVPEAVTGTKDAMRDEEYEVTPAVLDDDGNVVTEAVMGTRSVPDYQGIDQSKLVPLLVATIQELEARIAALEGAN